MEQQSPKDSEPFQLELGIFEGPLDLLLHLINQMEIDIYDIPIVNITDQYMNYLHQMQTIQIDVASEYFVMAATLMRIKSELLVPRNENQATFEEDFYDEEDPRKPLVDLLLEYKQIKEVVPKFEERSKDRAGFFGKDPSDISKFQETVKLKDVGLSIDDLSTIFQEVLNRHYLETPHSTTIEADEITVLDRMHDIQKRLKQSSTQSISFSNLFENPTKKTIVVTFLALLELMKDNRVTVKQKAINEDISIYMNSKH